MNFVFFIVSTTRISPITVIIVVEVVGVIPRGHTSAGLPVSRQISASCASGLSGLLVITINFKSGLSLLERIVSSTISLVLPEFEILMSKDKVEILKIQVNLSTC